MELKQQNKMKLLAVTFVLTISWLSVNGQVCLYKLTEEPLLVLPCNPYPSDGITLHCTVRAPDFSFTIQWIWQADSSSELIELLDSSDMMKVRIDTVNFSDGIRSRLNVRNLINRVGMFWCRATLSNGTQLEDSSKLTLYNQNVYENDMNCTNEELSEQSSTGRCINAASSVAETPPLLAMDQITSSPTTMAGNETTPPAPDSLGPALYAVIAVILVFCLVIVTLTVTIVLLYRRRKCGRGDIKTADQAGSNPYSGFTTDRERVNELANGVIADNPSSLTSSTHSTRPHHLSTHSPAPLISSSMSPQDDYSRLIRSHSSSQSHHESIAPGYSKLVIGEEVPQQSRESRIYNELEDKDLERYVSKEVSTNGAPPMNIYNSLDGPGRRFSASNVRNCHPDYNPVIPRRDSEKSTKKSSTLFDDPDYSPVKKVNSKKEKRFEIIDPRYTGDYERSPEYTCPTVKIKTNEIDPKYRGDYERDPNYIPQPPPRRASFTSSNQNRVVDREPEPVPRRQSVGVDALSKYRGDYERNPTYVPSPLREDRSLLGRKYSGNYERDPIYMANVLKKSRDEREGSTDYSDSLPKNCNAQTGYVNVEQRQPSDSDHTTSNSYSDSFPRESVPSLHSYVNVKQGSEDTHVVLSKTNPYSDSFLKHKGAVSPIRDVIVEQESESSANELLEQGTFMDI